MTDIKIIKLINGDDIVCSFPKKQLEQKSPLIRIVKPHLLSMCLNSHQWDLKIILPLLNGRPILTIR